MPFFFNYNYFLRPYPGMFLFVLLFHMSVQPSSAPLQQVSTTCSSCCHLYSASSQNSFCSTCFVFFVALVFLVGVFVVLSYPVRWHSIGLRTFAIILGFLCLMRPTVIVRSESETGFFDNLASFFSPGRKKCPLLSQ